MRILVATDGSEFSRTTADYVARLAAAIPLEVDLTLVVDMHKIEYRMIADLYVDLIREGAKATAERILEREAEHLRSLGVAVTPRILYGDPASALCEAALESDVGLVVLGRRGHGDLQDILFGSVSNQLIHRCAKPALVLKKDVTASAPGGKTSPLRILLAVDGSRGADGCLAFLETLGPAAAEVTLLNVVNQATDDVERLPGDLRHKALLGLHQRAEEVVGTAVERLPGFTVHTRVEEGKPGPVICRVVEEDGCEIVVVGRRGMGEIEDILFGSVSHYVLHHSRSHVLLVP